MEALFYVYLFLFGLVCGSFFNVVGMRTAENRSIITPGSHCPKCRHPIAAKELIPVVSYILQKGRCKHCQHSISLKYPFFELSTACLFAVSPLAAGWSKELLAAFLLISLVVIVTVSDLHKMLIPNRVLLFFGMAIFITRLFAPMEPWWDPYAGSLLGFGLLYVIAAASKGGMGGGDIKLFAVLGLFVGVKGIVLTLFFAAFFGMLFGLALMAMRKFKRKQPIPFAPFIGLAVLVSYAFGEQWWDFYFRLF